MRMPSPRSIVLTTAAALVLPLLGVAPSAEATPLDVLAAAIDATDAGAETGMDVVRITTYSRANPLGRETGLVAPGNVPAGGSIREHLAANPDGTYYRSVRLRPGKRLLGASGRTTAADGGLWATMSMFGRSWASAFASGRGLTLRTAITDGGTDRMGGGDLVADQPTREAGALILPPYAGDAEDYWTDVTTEAGPDGTTIVRGRVPYGDGEADDRCTYPRIRVVVAADGRISSADWRRDCPSKGTMRVSVTGTYGPQAIKPAPEPRISMNAAMARRADGAAAGWKQIAKASSRAVEAAVTSLRAVERINDITEGWTTANALDLDTSVTDPATGRPSFSGSDDDQPQSGWNPVDGYWVATANDSYFAERVAAAGFPAARYVVQGTAEMLALYGRSRWGLARATDTTYTAWAIAHALMDLDELNYTGQPGRVTRKNRADGTTLYTVTPSPGRSWLMKDLGSKSVKALVVVDADGRVVDAKVLSKDGRGRLLRGGEIGFDAGVVWRVPPGTPTAPWAAVAPFLP